ncbi:hypothetical protein EIP86_001958 [Pleurotus ostreatoroseus]|nr:hypothetical protein EIP86_001958 [Pleurotus ostreatoroseus]
MPRDSRYLYLCIFEQRLDETPHPVPIGFLKISTFEFEGGQENTLVELRAECSKRGYMGQNHEFMFSSASCGMMCPVASMDECTISIEEYVMGNDAVYIRRIEVAEEPMPKSTGTTSRRDSFPSDDSQSTKTVTDTLPIIKASYILHCWGSKTEHSTSYTVTALPDYFFNNNATFAVFTRAVATGRRSVFSIESAFQDKSLFYVGTCKGSRAIECFSLPGEIACTVSDFAIQMDSWTHLALVWNVTGRELLLYVNGRLARQETITREDRVDFLTNLKTTQFVLGRSKANGSFDAGWDGDVRNFAICNIFMHTLTFGFPQIADARVYAYAMDETEIGALAAQVPKPINPNYPNAWNDRKC